ncbi:Sporulation-control protein spo0M [Bacillus sp. THAF10]|uniref:sporulation protein n=1 Tax=Bacillus sp. THAF10 TaxID=2587848 RepID=UPI0012696CD9|nr:sporulation protein [Bacillus sp. THAF10]QFT89022.1 Sporulation-control protein spo0M [Bacillus sp. THAF10]
MSFFNKALASIGIGSAKVDTKLSSSMVKPGEILSGVVEITGGSTEQKIDEIYLSLLTNYIKESNDTKVQQQAVLEKMKIVDSFVISANEKKEIPFTFMLPHDTPISLGKTKVWLQTGLDIKNAIDPSDKDMIVVEPSPLIATILGAAEQLGFQLRKVESEAAPYKWKNRLPFIQEFEFYPTSGPFRGRLDEIEMIFLNISGSSVDLHLQVDRRARGLGSLLSEALNMDETFVKLRVTTQDLHGFKQQLEQTIQRYS